MPTTHEPCALWLLCCIYFCCWAVVNANNLTTEEEPTYGYIHTARASIIERNLLGMGEEWKGGDMENHLPTISLTILVMQPVPFFDMFLEKIKNLDYPKNKLHIFVYCNQLFHDQMAKSFIKRLENEYLSAKIVLSTDGINGQRGRKLALMQTQNNNSDYMLLVKADAHIDDPELLRELLIANKQFIASVFKMYDETWINFWKNLNDGGTHARLDDVNTKKGSLVEVYNISNVSNVYLIKKTVFKHIEYKNDDYDLDLAIFDSLRKAGISMYVIKQRVFGHLVNAKNFNSSVVRPDLHTIFSNKYDWFKKYVHHDYAKQLEPNTTYAQPCLDVFWFPIVTETFCDDLLAIMKDYGKWGSNYYHDTVPTRDIHLILVGLHPLWSEFLDSFVRPLARKVFLDYEKPRSHSTFVVRYHPDEQSSLRPHYDASTFTINIALNHFGIDYQGGGCNFLNYNCSIIETKKGWMIMHPGVLTHMHEGLTVINGTRYIMVSFVDP